MCTPKVNKEKSASLTTSRRTLLENTLIVNQRPPTRGPPKRQRILSDVAICLDVHVIKISEGYSGIFLDK